jgi:uncharacterized membrane protein (DUF2068 family)
MTTPPSPESERHNPLLPLIGAFKLIKAVVLFGAAYALHYLRHSDVEHTLTTWVRVIHFDPESIYMHRAISAATGIPPERLHHTGIGLFIYAVLFATEGTGLLLRKRWAEYVTVVTTSLLLPLEVYELFRPGRREVKVALLVLNLAILAYLIWNLARTRRREAGLRPVPAPAAP